VSITLVNEPKYVVGIIGGAIAGSTAAEVLSDAGVICVVFDQNERPYGKIEDGLPRWHVKQRHMEYQRIDSRLDRSNVYFVPQTRLGRDLDFRDLLTTWGWSALILANGAWRDRPLSIADIDQYVGKGLVYQNPFIYWFNHKEERTYTESLYEIPEGTIVIGGGLASLDVVKVVQLELYEKALKEHGIETGMLELEQKGMPAVCASHNVKPEELGVRDVVLYYRRRDVDMPLAQPPDNATAEQLEKTQQVRKKILSKLMEKYRVRFQDCHMPIAPLVEGGRLAGLRFVRTQVEDGAAAPTPGTDIDVYAPLVISSIGSIPEPLPGIQMRHEYYCFKDSDTGEYAAAEGVFGLGNVVTGKGNIEVSRKNAMIVSKRMLENYLGLGNGDRDLSPIYERTEDRMRRQVGNVQTFLKTKAPLAAPQVNSILARVHQRREQVGYTSYHRAA
jgi:NADPH-dependent glutamate synthase beta subunit-like oxidoreductase